METNMPSNASSSMGLRGATRSMSGDMGDPYSGKRHHMLAMHHQQTLWVYWLLILFGAWLLVSPFTFGYDTSTARLPGDRTVWLSLEHRILAMQWSDVISGFLLLIFGWRSLTPNRPYSLWVCCFIGIWLTFAPIVFWAPKAATYLNDTFVGAWVIGLTVLIAGMPNMMLFMEMGASTPAGWSYNPSSWPQRWIMILTGFLGWVVSRYLAAYQLGYTTSAWDPFFHDSMARVLTSDMSESLPISDAGLGAIAYTFECLMGFMGSSSRWRTMPWMVTFFGILVIPLGLVHIFLVISQPVVVGAWCTFCLLAAAIMLPMIPLEVDEVVAMGQYLARARKRGESFWKVFWKGGAEKESPSESSHEAPDLMSLPEQTTDVLKASVWGMTVPWNLFVTLVLGVWLVFSPAFWSPDLLTQKVTQVSGLLAITFSVLAMGEVIRSCRFFNVLIGLAFSVFAIIETNPWPFAAHNVIFGLLISVFSIPKGPITQRYGTWERFIV